MKNIIGLMILVFGLIVTNVGFAATMAEAQAQQTKALDAKGVRDANYTDMDAYRTVVFNKKLQVLNEYNTWKTAHMGMTDATVEAHIASGDEDWDYGEYQKGLGNTNSPIAQSSYSSSTIKAFMIPPFTWTDVYNDASNAETKWITAKGQYIVASAYYGLADDHYQDGLNRLEFLNQ